MPHKNQKMASIRDKRYPCTREPRGTSPPVTVDVLETDPNVIKCVTKRYTDGRTLTMVLLDEKIVEKSLTYRHDFDLGKLNLEKKKGASISFKYWVKGGLEVSLTYFGTYLLGKMFTLDFEQIAPSILRPVEDWSEEIENDIPFPTVNIDKIPLSEGYSLKEKENPYLAGIFLEEVLRLIVDDKKNRNKDDLLAVDEQNIACVDCDLCGVNPCVWLSERDRIITNDKLEHEHVFGVENKTRRKVAFRYMFRVLNGGAGQKGVRKRQPVCVENGVRALFPDLHYMGFKEE
jgi:hypothetical protein